MANLTEFTDLSGKKDKLSIASVWSRILGVMVMMFALFIGEQWYSKLSGRSRYIGAPQSPFYHPSAAPAPTPRVKF